MEQLENFLDDHFQRRDIVDCERRPYLTRWHITPDGAKIAVMVHKFHRSDEDRALHDHPWAFITFILTGGYYEHTECEHDGCYLVGRCPYCNVSLRPYEPGGTIRKWHRRWSLLYRPAEWKHRVELRDAPVWTFVIHFGRKREWGFWESTGFVHWKKWWRNNCE